MCSLPHLYVFHEGRQRLQASASETRRYAPMPINEQLDRPPRRVSWRLLALIRHPDGVFLALGNLDERLGLFAHVRRLMQGKRLSIHLEPDMHSGQRWK